jgi:enoyl-CoA hydratase/carnithine racemase
VTADEFADTHARVGIPPGGGMTARLPQLVGAAMARRMSMTGEVVEGAIAGAQEHDLAGLEQRRLDVIRNNKSQIAGTADLHHPNP